MHLIAIQQFTYANLSLSPGDRFDAPDEDARILKGYGRAIDDPRDDRTEIAMMTTTSAEPIAPIRAPRGSRYRRADMRAED